MPSSPESQAHRVNLCCHSDLADGPAFRCQRIDFLSFTGGNHSRLRVLHEPVGWPPLIPVRCVVFSRDTQAARETLQYFSLRSIHTPGFCSLSRVSEPYSHVHVTASLVNGGSLWQLLPRWDRCELLEAGFDDSQRLVKGVRDTRRLGSEGSQSRGRPNQKARQ